MNTTKPKERRGFAAMPPDKQRDIAAKGGLEAQRRGTAHRFNSETGKAASRRRGVSPKPDESAEQLELGKPTEDV